MAWFKKHIYNLIKKYRIRYVSRLLDEKSKTLLDIGCQDFYLYDLIKNRYDIVLADIHPANRQVKKEDVQKLGFKDKSFDIVLCQEVLEHVPDPVKAISELKRVAKNQLIITVPNEPFFTLYRFLYWEDEHLWAIRPKLLRFHLGTPDYEATFFLKRYYIGIWNIKKPTRRK
jgi:ubiquinone/menaquinone biosynthesis C-methylase UbiE